MGILEIEKKINNIVENKKQKRRTGRRKKKKKTEELKKAEEDEKRIAAETEEKIMYKIANWKERTKNGIISTREEALFENELLKDISQLSQFEKKFPELNGASNRVTARAKGAEISASADGVKTDILSNNKKKRLKKEVEDLSNKDYTVERKNIDIQLDKQRAIFEKERQDLDDIISMVDSLPPTVKLANQLKGEELTYEKGEIKMYTKLDDGYSIENKKF